MCYIRTQWMISLLRTSSIQVTKNVNMYYIRTQWMISLLRTSSIQVNICIHISDTMHAFYGLQKISIVLK